MGIYLNPGNEALQEALDSEIYVDKSGLIASTNRVLKTRDKYLCVSRPRRFGKTMALDMLAAYYGRGCDSRALFEGLAIGSEPSFKRHLNRYDVIKLTMTEFLARCDGDIEKLVESIEKRVMRELASMYPDVPAHEDDTLSDKLAQTYQATKTPFVILMDEWDCVMREMQGDDAAQKRYLDWLRDLLKDRLYIALAYATGILPVKKYGAHSALNMFTEASILNARPMSKFTGFTEGEVAALCKRYDADIDEMRRWYDGYDVDGLSIFNPRSVVQSLMRGAFDSYWTRTETYEALRHYIMLDMDGLKPKVTSLIGGQNVPVNVETSQNDMTTFASADDVLTLLVHLGYLTYDNARKTVRVPNSEVAHEFVSSIQNDAGWRVVSEAIAESEELMAATLKRDAQRVAEGIERAHRDNASVLRYNDENSLACAVSLAYYAARRTHTVEREAPAGKGFADLVFRPRPRVDAPALVVELKAGGTATEAIEQIKARRYADALSEYDRVLLVGIAYDPDVGSKDYKAHSCIIQDA